MHILELATRQRKTVDITAVEEPDFKRISVKRHLFRWKQLTNECRLFKLTLAGSNDVLGLVALVEYPDEQRIEIKLLTVSIETLAVINNTTG